MAIAVRMTPNMFQVIAGYESGHTMVYLKSPPESRWQTTYSSQPHSQPVLSLSLSPSHDYYLTSSADAIIAKHPLPSSLQPPSHSPLKSLPQIIQTHHSGQQGLSIRSDDRIFATSGWDARLRIYSAKTMKELAVLKWHGDSCYTCAFAPIGMESTLQSAEVLHPRGEKTEHTNRAGDDGQETTHQSDDEEQYREDIDTELARANKPHNSEDAIGQSEQSHITGVLKGEPSTTTTITETPKLQTVTERREAKVRSTHWLAAGSKDGKVSLWDIY